MKVRCKRGNRSACEEGRGNGDAVWKEKVHTPLLTGVSHSILKDFHTLSPLLKVCRVNDGLE